LKDNGNGEIENNYGDDDKWFEINWRRIKNSYLNNKMKNILLEEKNKYFSSSKTKYLSKPSKYNNNGNHNLRA